MNEMNLGRSALRVPCLGIGAMTWGEPKEIPRWNPARFAYGLAEGIDEQKKALEVSIAAGVTLVDTAAFYGKGASERRVGELARDRGGLLATKFPFRIFAGAGTLPRDLEDSLSRLRRQTVDLYQIHFPAPWRSIPRLMHLMADAVEAGKVRAVGVSNFSAVQMRQAHAVLATRGIPLASNQVEYSLLHRAPEVDGVLDACRELGVTLIAYQPLASGALTGKYSAANPPTGMRRRVPMFRGDNLERLSPTIALMKEIGARYQKSPAQVALRWLIERGALPIPGAKNSTQAAHNAGALGFSLAAGEMEAIDKAATAWKKQARRATA
jgi:aryl-alcohol dehydrogenase-like predicted oxidoreductase